MPLPFILAGLGAIGSALGAAGAAVGGAAAAAGAAAAGAATAVGTTVAGAAAAVGTAATAVGATVAAAATPELIAGVIGAAAGAIIVCASLDDVKEQAYRDGYKNASDAYEKKFKQQADAFVREKEKLLQECQSSNMAKDKIVKDKDAIIEECLQCITQLEFYVTWLEEENARLKADECRSYIKRLGRVQTALKTA